MIVARSHTLACVTALSIRNGMREWWEDCGMEKMVVGWRWWWDGDDGGMEMVVGWRWWWDGVVVGWRWWWDGDDGGMMEVVVGWR